MLIIINKAIIGLGFHLHNSSTRGCEYYRDEIFESFCYAIGAYASLRHACMLL